MNTLKCPYCRLALDDKGQPANQGEYHSHDCADRPLSSAEVDRLFGQRKRKVATYTTKGREIPTAPLVSAAHHLDVVMSDPELRGPAEMLLEELATLSDLCSATKGAQTDKEGGRSAGSPVPSFKPAHAAKKRTQIARRLNEEAEALAGWVHSPKDPHDRPGTCLDCGGGLRREAKHCVDCGAPTLWAFRR